MNLNEIEALLRTHLDDIYSSTGRKFYILRYSTRIVIKVDNSREQEIRNENGAKEYLKKVYESLEKELVQTEQEKQEIEEAAKKLWEEAAKKLREDYIRDIKMLPKKNFHHITAY